MMGTEPCATLKALVEHSWQGLARSTRRALRNAPQFACDSMWAADSLIGELLNQPGLWEHHLGAEMMSRAYAMPPDYRERTPALPAVPVEAPVQVRREERGRGALGAESPRTQSSELSESDWTILAEDAEAEIEMA